MTKGCFGLLAALAALAVQTGGALAEVPASPAPDHGASPVVLPAGPEDPLNAQHLGVILPGPAVGDGPLVPCEGGGPSPCESGCGPGPRFWVSAEYLLWWIKDSRLPALVSTSPPGSAGIFPAPNSTVLFGNGDVDNEERSGGRFTAGLWLDYDHTLGVEGSYLFLGSRSVPFQAGPTGSPGSPVLARPFFNVLTNQADAELVSFPGVVSGTVHVNLSSRLQGAEANAICNLCRHCCCDRGYQVDLLAGFRYLRLDEGLGIAEDLTVLPGSTFVSGANVRVLDQFDAHNDFYGGQFGIRAEVQRGRLSVTGLAKVALGDTHEVVDINGATVITPAGGGPATTASGGLLAQRSNIGTFRRDQFAVVPEAGIHLGFRVTDHLRALVGYSFVYASNVVRPGEQIDPGLNVHQLPTAQVTALPPPPVTGPARPAFSFRDTDFWAQGLDFGLEFHY